MTVDTYCECHATNLSRWADSPCAPYIAAALLQRVLVFPIRLYSCLLLTQTTEKGSQWLLAILSRILSCLRGPSQCKYADLS